MEQVLQRIHADTLTGQGHGWISQAEYQGAGTHFAINPSELFDVNGQVKSPDGSMIAARLKDKAHELMKRGGTPTRTYEIKSGVPIPDMPRRGMGGLVPRKSEYPLDTMPVNACFDVPPKPDEDVAGVVRRLGSIVSATNRRLHPKVFRVYPTPEGVARVFRLADTDQPLKPPQKRTSKNGGSAATPIPPQPTFGAQTPFPAQPAPVQDQGFAGFGGQGQGQGGPDFSGGFAAPAGFGGE